MYFTAGTNELELELSADVTEVSEDIVSVDIDVKLLGPVATETVVFLQITESADSKWHVEAVSVVIQ